MASGHGRNNRAQRSLEGLLKFSIENSGETGETQNDFQEMSEERKQWLQEAVTSIIEGDDIKKMKACLDLLNKPAAAGDDDDDDDEKVTESEEAFDTLSMLTEGIDNAMDLHKIGGFQIFVRYLNSSRSSLRWRAANLLAVCTQNNPYCQKAALELNVIPLLLELVDSDTEEQVRLKALYALSCLCRDFTEAENIFVNKDGFSVLMRAIQSDDAKLKIKAAFMLKHLLVTSPFHKDVLLNMGMIEQLIVLLQQPNELFHEHVLSVLLSMTQGCPRATQECCRTQLNLENILQDKVAQCKNEDPEKYEDVIRLCIDLLEVCKKQSDTESSCAVTR